MATQEKADQELNYNIVLMKHLINISDLVKMLKPESPTAPQEKFLNNATMYTIRVLEEFLQPFHDEKFLSEKNNIDFDSPDINILLDYLGVCMALMHRKGFIGKEGIDHEEGTIEEEEM